MLENDLVMILFKFLAAAAAGSVIGLERERSHRAAGFRTHFLVAIGSAIVMITGEQLTARYGIGNADPTRLAAQVVSGIGFLGAGTILKDGINVRGLTTAASLWATGCIGIAAGAGMFAVTLIGTVGAFLALTVLETVESRLVKSKNQRAFFEIHYTESSVEMNNRIYAVVHQNGLDIVSISILNKESGYKMDIKVGSQNNKKTDSYADLCTQLALLDGVTNSRYSLL